MKLAWLCLLAVVLNNLALPVASSNSPAATLATLQIGTWQDVLQGQGGDDASSTAPPVLLGTSLTLTGNGAFAEESLSLRRGYELFVNWINDARKGVLVDGVLRRLSLLIIDDQSNVTRVGLATAHLVNELGIQLLLGPAGAVLTEPAAAVAHNQGALLLSPTSTAPNTFVNSRSTIFGLASATLSSLNTTFETLIQGSRETSSLVVLEEATNGQAVPLDARCTSLHGMLTSFGLQTATSYTIQEGSRSNLVSVLGAMEQAPPDILAICLREPLCHEVLLGIKEREIAPGLIVFGDCALSEGFKAAAGEAAAYSTVLTEWSASSSYSPVLGWSPAEFAQRYTQLYRSAPPPAAAAAWSAASLLVAAIEAANSTDPNLVASSLRAMKASTILGDVAFDDSQQNTAGRVLLQQYDEIASHISTVAPADPSPSRRLVYPAPPWPIRLCFDSRLQNWFIGLRHSLSLEMGCISCSGDLLTVEWQQAGWNGLPAWICTGGVQENVVGDAALCDKANRQHVPPVEVGPPGTCGNCKTGAYVDSYGFCQLCELGSSSNASDSPLSCDPCPSGWFADAIGSTSCQECPEGSTSRSEGMWQCEQCGPGTFSKDVASTECTSCEIGKVASSLSSSSCSACPPGSYSAWDATQCTLCSAGQYQSQWQSSACIYCPLGSLCTSPGQTIPVTQGNWYITEIPGTSPATEPQVPQNVENTPHRWYPCGWTDLCLEGAWCAVGQVGLLCQVCEPKYDRQFNDPTCRKCEQTGVNIAFWCIGTLIFGAITVWVTKWAVQAAGEVKALTVALVKMLFNYLITMSLSAGIFVLVLKDKYEGASKAEGFTKERQPVGLTLVMQWDFVYFLDNVYSPECGFQPSLGSSEAKRLMDYTMSNHTVQSSSIFDEERRMLQEYHWESYWKYSFFTFCTPALLCCLLLFTTFIATLVHMAFNFKFYQRAHRYYRNVYEHGFPEATRMEFVHQGVAPTREKQRVVVQYIEAYSDRFLGIYRIKRLTEVKARSLLFVGVFLRDSEAMLVTVLFFVYLPVLLAMMRPMYCDRPLDGTVGWRLIKWPDVHCYNDDEGLLAVCIIGVVIATVGLPLILAWRVNMTKRAQKWSLLLSGYKADCAYWESVIFVRKALGVALMALPMDIGLRVFLLLVLARGYSLVHTRFAPLDNRFNGILERLERRHLRAWSMYCLCIIYVYFDTDKDNTSAMVVSIGMLIMHGFMILLFLRHILRHHLRHAFVEQAVSSIQRHEQLRLLVKQVRPPQLRSGGSLVVGYVLEPAPKGTAKLSMASVYGFGAGQFIMVHNKEVAMIQSIEDNYLILEEALVHDIPPGAEVSITQITAAEANTMRRRSSDGAGRQRSQMFLSYAPKGGIGSLISALHVRFSALMLRLHKLHMATMPRVGAGGESPWFAVLGRIRKRDVLRSMPAGDYAGDMINLVLPVGADTVLSSVQLPQGVMTPTDVHRRFALGILHEAFEHVVVRQGIWTFSSTLLEFLFRVPFTFHPNGQFRIQSHYHRGNPQRVPDFVQKLVRDYDQAKVQVCGPNGRPLVKAMVHQEDPSSGQQSWRHVVARMLDPHIFNQSLTLEDFQLSMNKLLETKGKDLALWLSIFETEWGKERVRPPIVRVVRLNGESVEGGLGFDYILEERTLCIVKIEDGGLLDQAWNRNNPDQQIRPGDCIIAINGTRGRARRMEEELKQARPETLIMEIRASHTRPPFVRTVRLSNPSGQSWGFTYTLDERALRVDDVEEGGLLNEAWNAVHPEHAIEEGDRIIAVNGLHDPEQMDEELNLQSSDIVMEVHIVDCKVGTMVRVVDASMMPHLGESAPLGKCVQLDEHSGRWEVKLHNGEVRSVAPENLRPIRHAEVQKDDETLPPLQHLAPESVEPEDNPEDESRLEVNYRPEVVHAWMQMTAQALLLMQTRWGRLPGVMRVKQLKEEQAKAKARADRAKRALNAALDELAHVRHEASLSHQELEQEIARLEAELETLKKGHAGVANVDVEVIGVSSV